MNNNKSLEDALNEPGWAIIWTAAGKFLGQIVESDLPFFVLKYPLEFHDSFLPQQLQTPEGPRLGFIRHLQAATIGNCLDVEHTQLTVTPINVLNFANMTRADSEWHRNLIRSGIRAALEQRLKNSGLVMPTSNIQTGNA